MVQPAFTNASQQIMPSGTGRIMTARLVVRPYAVTDADQLAGALIERRGEDVTPEILADATQSAQSVIAELAEDQHSVALGLFLRSDDALVGEFGAKLKRAKRAREWSLYYATRRAYQGQGYMSEAVLAMLPQFPERLGAKFLVATTSIGNTRSQNILRKAGMRDVQSPGMHLAFEAKF